MLHTSRKLLLHSILLLAVLCFTSLQYTGCTKTKNNSGSVPEPDEHTKQQKFSVQLIPGEQSIIYFDNAKPLEQAFTLTAPEPKEFLPYPIQKRPALFIAMNASTLLLLVNRVGFVQLSLQQTKNASTILHFDTSITVENVPINTYTAGATWQIHEHQYLLLYKDHILDSNWLQTTVYDFYGDTVSAVELPAFPGNSSYSPYWVFPTDKNIWLIQYRFAKDDRSYTAFAQWNRTFNKISELAKSSFEKLLIPVGFDKAPEPVQAIGRIINIPVLLEYRKADGSILYINNNNIDDAVLGIAGTNDFGTYVLLEDGRYWLLPGSPEWQTQQRSTNLTEPIQGQFSVPLEDVHFKSALLLRTLFLTSWEENGIPDTGRSGITVMLIPEQ